MRRTQFCIKTTLILTSFFLSLIVNAQQLDSIIEEALQNNPEIQKFELRYKIASEKINEAITIPDTQIGVGFFVSEPETRTGAQRFKVSAKQMLPKFGFITARQNYLSSMADTKYIDITIAKRKLIVSVSKSYYRLYELKARQEVLNKNIALLKTYEIMALKSVEVDKASAVDVLRLQMRQNDLEQLRQVLTRYFIAEQTQMNKLLNRAKDTEITIVSSLTLPKKVIEIDVEHIDVHPELMKYDKLFQSVEQSELINQKERKPMVGFGLDYIAVSERPNMSFGDNGKDIVMPMISLSIPILNKKYNSKTKQNILQQKEIMFQKQDRQNRLETLLDKAINNKIASRISYETQVKNLQQAKNAEAILIKSYETGTIDFKDVLDIQELQLKFQMNQISAVKEYYIQMTLINYLTN